MSYSKDYIRYSESAAEECKRILSEQKPLNTRSLFAYVDSLDRNPVTGLDAHKAAAEFLNLRKPKITRK